MNLSGGDSPVQSGAVDAARSQGDPRVMAFCRLCNAIDFNDSGRCRKAQREMRSLGFNILYLGRPDAGQGGEE